MESMKKFTTCLWFNGVAEEAAHFYVSIFKNSSIGKIFHFSSVGQEIHGGEPGSVMAVEFDLDGNKFMGLNGGPLFKLTEAISFVIDCADQEEVDYYWDKLKEGGPVESQQCGWVKDKFGVSWQVVPTRLNELLEDPDTGRSDRAMAAMLEMKKLDIAKLEEAANGA
jgi:predicted 3-demethylubiquinone-9 3-methyltransferase (glyoxalase superfamily)